MIHGRFLWDLLAVIYSSFIYLYLTSSLPDLDLVSPCGRYFARHVVVRHEESRTITTSTTTWSSPSKL